MGVKTKLAKGPNPLSVKKKKVKDDGVPRAEFPGEIRKEKKRRLRKGRRSKALSLLKK